MLNSRPGISTRLVGNKVVRFLVAGGLAALVNFSSRFFYSLFVNFEIAVVLAYMTGMATAFTLNKLFVFTASRNSTPTEIGWFVVVNMFALAQTWVCSVYLAQVLPDYLPVQGALNRELSDAIAHGVGVIVPAFTSYLGHTYLTFRE